MLKKERHVRIVAHAPEISENRKSYQGNIRERAQQMGERTVLKGAQQYIKLSIIIQKQKKNDRFATAQPTKEHVT